MAKTKLQEYSATAASNTDIDSTNIDEGCSPAGINNAIRSLMAHLKTALSGSDDSIITGTAGASGTLGAFDANGDLIAATAIDGLPIGGTTPAAGTFSALTATTTGTHLTLAGDTDAKIRVEGGDSSQNFLDFNSNTTTQDFILRMARDTNTSGLIRWILYEGDGTGTINAQLGNSGVNSYVVVNGGSFGVGTASPSTKLDVAGNVKVADRVTLSGPSPEIDFEETDQATDEKVWRFSGFAGGFYLQTRTDAGAAGQNVWIGSRGTGTDVTEQRWFTGDTERLSITDTGVQMGATGARVTDIQTTITDSNTKLPTSGAVVDHVAATVAWTTETEVTTTGGTAINFTGIPAGVEQVVILFDGLSLSGNSDVLVQIGDSGGIETTGYKSASNSEVSTAGFIVRASVAANVLSGEMVLNLWPTNKWSSQHGMGISGSSTENYSGGGTKTLSGELTQIRITTVNGTDTFDANGGVNIKYR